jgi:hypothetical protein
MGLHCIWQCDAKQDVRFFQCQIEAYSRWDRAEWMMGWRMGQEIPNPVRYRVMNRVQPINFFHTGSTAFLVSGRVAKVAMVNSISALGYVMLVRLPTSS